jgi:two-component system response regulator HydG
MNSVGPPLPDVVCLVDDDSSVLKGLGRLLTSDGLRFQSFNDAKEFLEFVTKNPVPLAVIDVWMEGMTGLEAQACLRDLSPQTRVIIMTGRDDPKIRNGAVEGGAVAYLIKPFDYEVFLKAVHEALGHN